MSRSYRFAIIALGLTLATSAFSEIPLERPHEAGDAQYDTPCNSDEQGIERLSSCGIPVAIFTSQKEPAVTKEEPNEEDAYKFAGDSLAQWIMAAFGLIGTSVSVLAVYLLKATLKANQDSTNAAIEMAGLAREANKLTRDSMVADKRAWLMLEDISLQPGTIIQENGAVIVTKTTIRNIGHTPALNVWLDMEVHFLREDVSFGEAETAFKNSKINFNVPIGHTLFPNDSLTQNIRIEIKPDAFSKSINVRSDTGERCIYAIMFMAVVYRVFGEDHPHITYVPLDLLNLKIGLKVPQNSFVMLSPVPFNSGEVT